MKIKFHPEARSEMASAIAWYKSKRPELGRAFAREVGDAILKIEQNPLAYAEAYPGFRRCVMWRFPYNVIYAVSDELLMVVAIVHQRRDPDWIRDRLN